MHSYQVNKTIELAKKKGVIRPRDLDEFKIPRKSLNRLFHAGIFRRVARGLYELTDIHPTDRHTFAEVARRIPNCVICLLSALNLYGLTSHLPHEVWVAINVKARYPKEPSLPMRIMRFSGKSLTSGVVRKQIEGVKVKVYNPAKTVADCFKYRNKIGKDVAIESLRDCLEQRLCTVDDLRKYAKICRVANVMKPYLEALI